MEGTGELPGDNSNEPAAPLYFGNYEVLKSIGKGKFAVVYRAKKIGDDQVIALKRIAVDMMNDKAKEKCLKEVRLLQNLDHPNIIRYMDSFLTDNDLFIAYEWAAAGDLKRQLRKAQERGSGFEERVIWKYFSQISNAVKYMHDKRIMHRDLKPANIFLTLDGTIKVGDLGLSRELSEHTIQAHSKVGTPLYMSPEVLNKGEGYDFKSDIWSLGCLLYELAMLKSPFKAEGLNLYSLFQKISNGDYVHIPENTFSDELRNLTDAMLSTQPEDRPEMSEVARIAQEMRTFTANEKSSKSKSKKAAGGEGTSRPNSGAAPTAASVNTNNNGNVDAGRSSAQADAKSTEPNPYGNTRGDAPRTGSAGGSRSSSTRTGAIQREGSFHLEYVNGDEDKGYDNGDADSKPSSRPTSHIRDKTGQRNQRGDHRISPDPDPEDAEDEVTVGLGQGDFLMDRHGPHDNEEHGLAGVKGVVELGSDNTRNSSSSGYNKSNNGRNTYVNNVKYDAQSKKQPEQKEEEEVRPTFNPDEFRATAPRDYNSVMNTTAPLNSGNNTYNPVNSRSKSDQYDRSPSSSPNTGIASHNNIKAKASSNMYYSDQGQDNNNRKSGAVAPLPDENTTKNTFSNTTNSFNATNPLNNTANNVNSSTVVSKPPNSSKRNPTSTAANENSTFSFTETVKPTAVGLKLEEHLENASLAFAIMSSVYDKLLLLNCPLNDPNIKEVSRDKVSLGRLLPFHFACDLQLYPSVAGHERGFRFMQFQRFAYVALWLVGAVSTSLAAEVAKSVDVHSDTPVMMAKQILRLTQMALGGSLPTELNNITPTSLTVGHGVNVCNILSSLADAALSAAHFEVHGTVQRGGADAGLNIEAGGQEGDDEEMEDEAVMVGSDDEGVSTGNNKHTATRGHAEVEEDSENSFAEYSVDNPLRAGKGLGMSVILGTIDPAQWKLETDRVAVKLSAAGRNRGGIGGALGSDWADHVDALKGYAHLNVSNNSNANSDVRSVKEAASSSGAVAAEVTAELAAQLQRTVLSLESALKKIKQAEAVLNKTDAVTTGALTYSTHKAELLEKEARIVVLQKALSESTQRLAELQERCDEVSETLNSKTGGEPGSHGDSNSAGGAMIVRLKDGLKTIKQEINEISMGIMMMNHNLMVERVGQVKSRQTQNHRRAQRKKTPKDSILSDDELFD